MNERRPYTFVVLKYVHDVVSGEFVNVGVVLFSPVETLVRYKTRKTIGRIKKVFPDLDRLAFIESMRAIDRGLRKQGARADLFSGNETAETYAKKILPDDDTSLQWSKCGSGVTSDTDKALEKLFERHVGRYDMKSKVRRSDEDVWRPVRESLKERGVDLPLQSKTIVGSTDEISFEKAWKNGNWHAYEALSMDLSDAKGIKDKARLLRGHLDAVGANDEIELRLLLGFPENAELLPAFENAKDIISGSSFKPEVFDESQIDDLINGIEEEFRAHKTVHG